MAPPTGLNRRDIAEAHDWTETCRSPGIAITAPIEQVHERPWSTVFRVPTNDRAVYVKCCGSTQAHEPRLTALLHREFPGLVTEVLALHPTQPWMLVAEGGKKPRDAYSGDDFLRVWREVLPRYAQLQRAATHHVREILRFGTPDHRAASPGAIARQHESCKKPRSSGAASARSRERSPSMRSPEPIRAS